MPRFDRKRADTPPLCVRLNPAEKGAVKRHAKKIGSSVSELVRGLLLKAGIISVDMVPEPEPEAAQADPGATHGKGGKR